MSKQTIVIGILRFYCALLIGAGITDLTAAESGNVSGEMQETDEKAEPSGIRPAIIRLSLQDAIETALQSNRSLRLKRIDDSNATLSAFSARAKFLPSLTVSTNRSGSIIDEDEPNTNSSISMSKPLENGGTASVSLSVANDPGSDSPRSNSVTFSLSKPLLRGAGADETRKSILTAEINRLKARANLELEAQNLKYTVTDQFYGILRRQLTLEVNRRSVERARKFLEITIAREQAKQTSMLEVQNARVQLAGREVNVLRSDKSLEEAKDALKRTLNIDYDLEMQIVAPPISLGAFGDGFDREFIADEQVGTLTVKILREGENGKSSEVDSRRIFQAVEAGETALLRLALAQRIEVINARREVQKAWLDYRAQVSAAGQDITFSASYNRSGSGLETADSFYMNSDGWSLGLTYRYTFGQVGDRVSLEKKRLVVRRRELEYSQTENDVKREVRALVRDLEEARRLVFLQAYKVEQAQRVVKANHVRFDRGLIDSFNVIQAEDDLLQAETDLADQIVNYFILVARMDRVTGKPTGRIRLFDTGPISGISP